MMRGLVAAGPRLPKGAPIYERDIEDVSRLRVELPATCRADSRYRAQDRGVRQADPVARAGERGLPPIDDGTDYRTVCRHGIDRDVGDPRYFASGRHFAAWIGLVPKQYSTGGK